MTKSVEKRYPLTIGIAVAVAVWACQMYFRWHCPKTAPSLFSAVINVCAISIGFLGAAQSILISMEDRKIVVQLKDSGTYDRIVSYVLAAITWSFWLAAGSALAMLLDMEHPKPCFVPIISLWCGLLVTASLAYYRIIRIFAMILRAGSSAA